MLTSKSKLKGPQHGRVSHPFICSIALGSSAEQLLNNIQAVIASSPDQAGATLQHGSRVCGHKDASLMTSAKGTVTVIVIGTHAKCLSPIAKLDWKPTCLSKTALAVTSLSQTNGISIGSCASSSVKGMLVVDM